MGETTHRHFANVPVTWKSEEDSGKILKDFVKAVERKYNVTLTEFSDLYEWSIKNVPQFWEEMWNFTGIIHSKPFRQVIDLSTPMSEPLEWFDGARMNFAENLLKYRDDHVALIIAGEDKETENVTYAQMYEEAKLYAAALRKVGVKKGDRVSCFMSNRKEAIFAMIGATSIGAIWLGASPLLGSKPLLNRFKQVQPKILFTVDRFRQDREEKEMLPKVKEIADELLSLENVVIVPSKPGSKLKDISAIRNSCFLDNFLEGGKNPDGTVPEMVFEQVSFSHPIFISYTSGTTGLPKALVHGCGGILSVARDCWLHSNADRSNCFLSVSPAGWVAWNIFSTMHILGSTIVVFEGIPFYLSPTFLWDMVDEFRITNLFLLPSVLDELEKKVYVPTERNHLSSLRAIASGGSVVKPQNYDFVYKKIKTDILYSSTYGSTELMGCYTIVKQTWKTYRGEFPAPTLGVDISCLDDAGNPVTGEIGELVINLPIPSLPLGLWGDTDRSIFKKTYFEKFPGRFAVGDLAIINPVTKGISICGRSDGALNLKESLLGSSEIYSIVDTFPEVRDSLCVSQYNKNREERAVLFLKMRIGHPFDENLVRRIKASISRELSSRHVPEVILETADIPHNMNGKKMEIVVKRIINKMPYHTETVINPECLENFIDVPELRGGF